MPRVKKNSDQNPEIKSEIKPEIKTEVKPSKKPKTKVKTSPKKVSPKKSARPIVIDVIEDDNSDNSDNFFPELPKFKNEPDEIKSEESIPKQSLVEEEEIAEIDQQKKFFSELVTEIKEKEPKEKIIHSREKQEDLHSNLPVRKSVNLYRRLVWRFIAFTIFLLIVVFYFSFSKLTITISPKGETINDSLLLKVQPDGSVPENAETDFREQVAGSIKELTVTEEKTFPATGEEFLGDEIYGQVKIINNSAKSQALVATTRILSTDNKLFRIKEAVNVPAGGEVLVDIYADKPSEEMAIGATNFTIPGLWLGLQDKIYAKSTVDFIYRQKVKKYIKLSDIERGTKEMNDLLIAKAKLNQSSVGENEEVLYETSNAASFEIDAKAGDAKEEFLIKGKVNLVIVTFSKEQAMRLAASKLALLVPDDKELADKNPSNATYTFDNYDAKTGIAAIKVNFGGTMVLKNNTEIIDKKQLVNLNREQLENYLKTFPEIKSYELNFFPSFINRAPRLPERIKIEIKDLEK